MLKRKFFMLFSVAIVAFASTVLCVYNYNPYDSKVYQFILFYTSLLLSLSSSLTLILYFTKIYMFNKGQIVNRFLNSSFRQSLLVSFGIVLILFLKGVKLFDLWIGIPLFISIILIEMFFQTKNRSIFEKKYSL